MPSNEAGGFAGVSRPYRVLVAGGSYAGLAATTSLLDLTGGRKCRLAGDVEAKQTPSRILPIEITIVDERDGFYHMIGGPLAIANEDYASKAWKKFIDIPALRHPAVEVIHGSIIATDCENKIATIRPHQISGPSSRSDGYDHAYDYFIVASGLRRTWPTCPQSLERVQYLKQTSQFSKACRQARDGVAVIGGGAVGIEIAAELKLTNPSQDVTLFHSRDRLLSKENLPNDFKDTALSILRNSGVNVILNQRTAWETLVDDSGFETYQTTLSDNRTIRASHVINAISQFTPTSTFLPNLALDPEGYIKIHPSLSFNSPIPNAAYHFAAGDIARWSGIKRCGAAMHQGHFAAVNLYQHILHEQFGIKPTWLELAEASPVMGLAIGKQAVTYDVAEGVKYGEDMMKLYFGDDLGFDICWNYMQLGKDAEA